MRCIMRRQATTGRTVPTGLSGQPIGDWFGVTTDGSGRVTELRLSFNRLRGRLPAVLGNLDSLTYLNLRVNEVGGSLPAELGNLDNLTHLHLEIQPLFWVDSSGARQSR